MSLKDNGLSFFFRHRLWVALALALCMGGIGIFLGLRLSAQLQLLWGQGQLQEKNAVEAIELLEAAVQLSPGDETIWHALGKAYHLAATTKTEMDAAYALSEKAHAALIQAQRLNPNEVEIAYHLALEEALLEKLSPYFQPHDPPKAYNALPVYEKVLALWPHGTLYRFDFLRYLRWKKNDERYLKEAAALLRLRPTAYAKVWWMGAGIEDLVPALRNGLAAAAAHKDLQSDAWRQLTKLEKEAGNIDVALGYLKKAIESAPGDKADRWQMDLARIYLDAGQKDQAATAFIDSMRSFGDYCKRMQDIYRYYRQKNKQEAFSDLYRQARERLYLPARCELTLARSFEDSGAMDRSRQVLEKLIEQNPIAPAYDALARLARRQKDWDAVELAAQRATVFEPKNPEYRYRFSSALLHKKKYDRAYQQIQIAVNLRSPVPARYYGLRARVYWGMGDATNTAADLKTAFSMAPGKFWDYMLAAQASRKAGALEDARRFARKALQLKPDNAKGQKLFAELEKGKR